MPAAAAAKMVSDSVAATAAVTPEVTGERNNYVGNHLTTVITIAAVNGGNDRNGSSGANGSTDGNTAMINVGGNRDSRNGESKAA